jgi:hypothetical protein
MLNESPVGLAMNGRERHAHHLRRLQHFGVEGIGAE